ncbi:4'-phosphopantetheinyl transferase family protein [Xylanimonas protaetiae]|uniref:4'-phosphopantetheinyl transferase superfamily protein n=1 Tax=Xylanimonas protaetiae TaxID=2509457 RepID=A0A4P6FCJ4_9MICO|nr:4'-phosphopantetheinyl transferase superfamily protein [Xylanimonas protaetiae]QAY71267.1 4'-phosphopantetheinyl transferase superfamily protein [Xylanimonas protaetiae]
MTVVRSRPVADAEDPTLLTGAERARRDRLRDPRDRAAYTAAHVLARECVAELTGLRPADVVLVQRCPGCGGADHGRPFVAGRDDVHASLSHARAVVAAVASFAPCGIDVEARGDHPAPRGALSGRERRWVEGQDDPGLAFLQLWVRKEALVKCGAGSLATAARLDVLGDDGPTGACGPFVLREWRDAAAVGAWAVAEHPSR